MTMLPVNEYHAATEVKSVPIPGDALNHSPGSNTVLFRDFDEIPQGTRDKLDLI
jgi:hypothetical protein